MRKAIRKITGQALSGIDKSDLIPLVADDDAVLKFHAQRQHIAVRAQRIQAEDISGEKGIHGIAIVGKGDMPETMCPAQGQLDPILAVAVNKQVIAAYIAVEGAEATAGGVGDLGVPYIQRGRRIDQDTDDGIVDAHMLEDMACGMRPEAYASPLAGEIFEGGFQAVASDDDGIVVGPPQVQSAGRLCEYEAVGVHGITAQYNPTVHVDARTGRHL